MATDQAHLSDRVSEFADLSMWKWGTPGMVLALTDRERTFFASAKGCSDAASMCPLSTDSLFQIGSVSKSFTCIALLQLAEKGLLDLHDPVTRHLPSFSIRSRHPEVTLHHLMTHTSGMIQGSDATPTAWTEVWDLRDTETSCEPGTHFHYSNSAYKTLGLVLETLSGRTYEDMIRDGILEPAGMRSTEAVITNRIRGRSAVAHLPTLDDRPSNRCSALSPAPWFEGDTADGSICAPIEDMMTYVRLLLNGGQGRWGRVISQDSYRLMTTPYITPDDGLHAGGYGYGLNVEAVDGHAYIGHQGGMVGHYTSMLMDKDLGIGVMVMVNGPGDPEEVSRFAIAAARAWSEGREIPAVPSKESAFAISCPDDYTGSYSGQHGSLVVKERNGVLYLAEEGREHMLEPRERDSFYVAGPGFEMFLLEFERVDGRIMRVHHGARTFARDGHEAGPASQHGDHGVRYEGHYRSHNPWLSNFRIVRRDSGLVIVPPNDVSQPLIPVGSHEFRIGADERSPERISFAGIVRGVATSATVSGGGRFGRTFTP